MYNNAVVGDFSAVVRALLPLTNLRELSFQRNGMFGTIPAQINNMTSLTSL
jgi:hypothetical protein